MSKYPVKYVSGSKGLELNIEDMATPHLCNAWRKLGTDFAYPIVEDAIPGSGTRDIPGRQMDPVRTSIAAEIRSRGGVYDAETDRWTMPAKAEEAP